MSIRRCQDEEEHRPIESEDRYGDKRWRGTPKTPAKTSFEPPQLQQLRAQLKQQEIAASEL